MKRFLQRSLICLFAAFSLLSLPAFAQQSELVKNGFFAGHIFPWWPQGSAILLQKIAGREAVLIPSGMVVQEKISVSGGRNYRLSMDIRSEATQPGTVYAQMSFRGAGVTDEWQGPAKVTLDGRENGKCTADKVPRTEKAAFVTGGDTAKWQSHAIVFTAPPEADQMVLYLRKAPCTPGAAAFTGISMTQTEEPATSVAEAARQTLVTEWLPPPAEQASNAALMRNQLARPAPQDGRHRLATARDMAMRVHVGVDEDVMTLQAASDLSNFSAQVAGAVGPKHLSIDEAVAEQPLLVVGRLNAFARKAFTEADFEELGDDGFLIRSSGPHILIAGRTPRGTMYGVNWFLDRKLGIRWLAPDVTNLPLTPDITLPFQHERQIPRFGFREVLSVEAEDKAWRQRNLMNGESHGPSFQSSPPALDSWDRSWASQGIIANFYQLLPPAIYRPAHPDWYAGGQLAMMNEEMRAEMARVVIERLRALPGYRSIWFSIHDMDWGWDMDASSKAFADRHGGYASAPRLDMMIDIARRVRAELPGARLAFNAYHWSFTPPEGMTVPDHILVYPMTIHVNYRDALNGTANAALGKDIAGWNKIARNVLIWDHITNFAGFIQPTPNIFPIGRSIQWLASLDHVGGYMGEGSFNTPGAEFASLRAWVIARLLWDPEQDINELVREFCEAYYGPAASDIIEYIRFYHDKISRTDDVLAEKTSVDMAMFDAEFVKRADSLFDKAEASVRGTRYEARVQTARMPVDYVILLRRNEYSDLKDQIGFDVNTDKNQRSARFWKAISQAGVTQYIQNDKIAALAPLLAIERRPPEKPDIAMDGVSWKDIQDISFQRFAGAKSAIVADPLASDGAAVALDRSSPGWNMQLKFDKLPKSGEWWLYAALRTDDTTKNEAVAKLGAAPPMDCFDTIGPDQLTSAAYSWFQVPGGPFSYTADHARSIYLDPLRGPEGSKVIIDRIVALSRPWRETTIDLPGKNLPHVRTSSTQKC
ncbi:MULTISPECIES: DUF4838 domain-containing protein [unclassified Agrobacterium]|uniref:DUF4838 domain-containing protein n=1 Tax=unclassified Agrobacterium TaxID=2632611 RepID=UPI0006996651|nr:MULTISPECIES: DUF4838 domain-containing protein [unclassified Agrobacterium]MCD4660139.1 DUF4838 domain-containing protein [Agrobacterium sp.]